MDSIILYMFMEFNMTLEQIKRRMSVRQRERLDLWLDTCDLRQLSLVTKNRKFINPLIEIARIRNPVRLVYSYSIYDLIKIDENEYKSRGLL